MSTEISQHLFIRLIQEHSGIIHKVLRLYVDDADDRADVYQEILLQAWNSFPRFRNDAKFSTWLYKVSLNTVFTLFRKNSTGKGRTPVEEAHALAQPNFDDADLLIQAMKRLNEIDRSLITLHLEGYDNEEISQIIGITKNHTGVKLHRIKKQLEEIIKQKGYGA